MGNQTDHYWKKIFGIELFKLNYQFKKLVYDLTGFTFPKLASQKNYWKDRGQVYMDEILSSGYLEREVFFQDMLIDFLKTIEFDSFFEAGCGFGWNIKRVKEEFPGTRVGGVDFSITQLLNSKTYLENTDIRQIANGDNCRLPYKDDAFDIGFSLGVFMNIHPDKIGSAIREVARVSKKYIIHLEYDETHTKKALRKKRAFKTNIVSHDYKTLYSNLGLKIVDFRTYKDFTDTFNQHVNRVTSPLDRWEGFEGPEKYIFIVIKK